MSIGFGWLPDCTAIWLLIGQLQHGLFLKASSSAFFTSHHLILLELPQVPELKAPPKNPSTSLRLPAWMHSVLLTAVGTSAVIFCESKAWKIRGVLHRMWQQIGPAFGLYSRYPIHLCKGTVGACLCSLCKSCMGHQLCPQTQC